MQACQPEPYSENNKLSRKKVKYMNNILILCVNEDAHVRFEGGGNGLSRLRMGVVRRFQNVLELQYLNETRKY